MIPQIQYTQVIGDAWWPSPEAAQGLADFCNFYWKHRAPHMHADIVENETGRQACVRVQDNNTGLGGYIKHPVEDF